MGWQMKPNNSIEITKFIYQIKKRMDPKIIEWQLYKRNEQKVIMEYIHYIADYYNISPFEIASLIKFLGRKSI